MHPQVVTKDPAAVQVAVQAAYRAIFPTGDHEFVPRVFGWTTACFTGNYRDYQPVDAPYHDFEHTLQGTLCLARLLEGRHSAGARPELTERRLQLGLLAILLHDTGYLKRRDDLEGTGAKYTVTHVERGASFAAELLAEKGFSESEIKAVRNMILCTGVNADLSRIPFNDAMEKIVGFAVGTADLLGQMAAEDYLERLPVLYEEFAEAARYSSEPADFIGRYSSAEDLMKDTPTFWKDYVQRKLNQDFAGLYRFLNRPYPDGPNEYLQRIEGHMERLRQRI